MTHTSSPHELGFAMPPEWAAHAATWTSWPFGEALWEGQLEAVRDEFAALVATVARYEPVVLNVRDEPTEQDAKRRLEAVDAPLANITFHRVPLNDVWFRDNGPLFVTNRDGQVALTDWDFNAWGEKYSPWDDDDRAPARSRGEGVLPITAAAVEAVRSPGTELDGTEVGGRRLGVRGRWVELRRRGRHPRTPGEVPHHSDDEPLGVVDGTKPS